MTVLAVLGVSIVALLLAGRFYARFLARSFGEDPSRPTPAVTRADGVDYVATPTPVVFAHHFASIAGAAPILGPVIAIIYGWGPAILWVVFGGIFLGAVHDYTATYMATREGGRSIATIARRYLGPDAFVALTLFLILTLALVCAAFLDASAKALTSMVPLVKLPSLSADSSVFRIVQVEGVSKVIVGGIASMSVVVITAFAPLLGWLYLKKKVSVWKCSLLAVAICAVSITIGVNYPVQFSPLVWKLVLSGYVLVAAGVPVWIFLQSRDFINVHILYVGMALLVTTLFVAGVRGGGSSEPLAMLNVAAGTRQLGLIWPFLFINIACGAVSGFHSLCAGGTTCKQLRSEVAARRVGYYAMLLESFLAVCVIGVLMIGAVNGDYLHVVHGLLPDGSVDATARSNPVLGFGLAVGNAGTAAFNIPPVIGVLAGMILLEGFLVTTLDTAIRLTRYLIEEVWRTFLGRYDVFAGPRPAAAAESELQPMGAGGLAAAPATDVAAPPAAAPVTTSGPFRALLLLLRAYWFNSALAVALMLVFAFSGGVNALWNIFGTSNQLLAAMGLSLGSIWLLRRGRRCWYVVAPAVFMLATTIASMVLLVGKYRGWMAAADPKIARSGTTLLIADLVMMGITAYLIFPGLRTLVRVWRDRPAAAGASAE